ncbi:MAG TPA: methylmalonyl-CoA mutase family protein [Acidobacteriota bacterium]|nr:methylmalonyl-CoA mutase family protein [Acidobacteriota bacterium]
MKRSSVNQKTLPSTTASTKEKTTISGRPVRLFYTPNDLPENLYQEKLSDPGEFPYTRGIHRTMYRGRLWTVRQFSGYGSAKETNRRFHFLLEQGQSGLSVAFDLPTLMGIDSDHPLAEGEVGKCGVAVDSLLDMERLFEEIDLQKVTTSMTINAPAAVLLAMYLVVAEKQKADFKQLGGTLQNDILKEYIAQKEWIYPPHPSMRLVIDTIEFCTHHLPRYNPISISGYHIREAGSTAGQELAFTLRNGIEYVEWCLKRGLDVDSFAPRLSFFFNAHNDFFEEIAKFRAARRLWAHIMRDRFNARNERSWKCRFHTQTAGCSLTAQQPLNNVIRTTIQALAGVLGGTNSLHTNAFDEALALPTERSARIALRTQQIIANESGVINTVDPLAGSYFVEALTNELEAECHKYFDRIDAMGGMVEAIEKGFPQREIQDAAYRYQKAVEEGEKVIVGVNTCQADEDEPIELLQIGEEVRERQRSELEGLRSRRDNHEVGKTLAALRETAKSSHNLMPSIIAAVRAYATLGEICSTLEEVFGRYEEPAL